MTRLHVAPRPCNTCPYRTDTPAGVWHPEEYLKLAGYDADPAAGTIPPLATFHCHQENATGVPSVCVGWLGCHGDEAIAVRLALGQGKLTVEDIERAQSTDVELYGSGAEACLAGLAGVENPGEGAVAAMDRLVRQGVGHR